MDLFTFMEQKNKKGESPLASRMRPSTLDEVVGQEHIIGKDKLLYRAIQADRISSVIFYGPPGTGKTTLAKVIASTTKSDFRQINATSAGKKDMEDVVEEAKKNLGGFGKRTILFIDEIHRFNKSQQDYLLPFVEEGTVILIGATTENPYFEAVNGALVEKTDKRLICYPEGLRSDHFEIPEGVSYITSYFLAHATNEFVVSVPYTVTAIEDHAFYESGCTRIDFEEGSQLAS